jgi:hypothetical protein
MRRVVGWLLAPAGLTGAFAGAALVAAQPGGIGLSGLVVGWLYGIVVGGAMRLFRVPAGALPLVGLLAGPLPIALLLPAEAALDARGLVWVGAFVGLLIGLVEWASARASGSAGRNGRGIADEP